MDRRQQKTRNAIFQALKVLLQKKHFNHITVQEIIDEANIGRSTFYSHFETKDDLLKSLCSDIFDHVFSLELDKESSHDYSEGAHDLNEMLEHMLCHLLDDKEEITQILSSDSEELFLGYLKDSLKNLFSQYAVKKGPGQEIPESFQVAMMTAGFVEVIRWWVGEDMEETPKKLVEYYLSSLMIKKK